MADTSPLLGRGRELAAVERTVRSALTGTPAVVVVAGDAGIGKSTLVRAAAERAHQLQLGVGVGQCLDVSSPRPQGPVLEALGQLGVEVTGTTVVEAARGVADRVSRGPTLMVIEDLQWAESRTRDVVRTLAHTMAGPLVLLVTVRTEDVPRSHPAAHLVRDVRRSPCCTVVELEPLDEPTLRRLAARRLGADPAPELVSWLVRRSEGNPLYAEELLDADGTSGRDGLPPRLADLFLARVDRLPALAPTVLRAAAVAGLRVEEPLTGRATRLPPADVTAALKAARDQQLLVVRNRHLEFRHALLRDALYEDLLPAERAELHRRVAEELERRCATVEDPDPATLGSLSFHAERAGDAATALVASVRAGRLWQSQGAGSSADHLVRALGLWDRVPHAEELTGLRHAELLLLTGRAATDHNDNDRARALLRAAVEEAEAGTDRTLVSRAYAAYAVNGTWAGDPLSERALPAALEAAGPEPSRVRADALTPAGFNHWMFGRLHATKEAGREIHAIGTSLGDVALQAIGHALVGLATARQGYVRTGSAEVRRAIEEATRAHRLVDSLFFEGMLAATLAVSGPCGPALRVAEAALQRARQLHLPGCEPVVLEQISDIRIWSGELQAAAEVEEELRRSGLWDHRLGWGAMQLLLALGDLDGASAALAEQADDEMIDEPPPDVEGMLAVTRTELHLARGDLASASESVQAALAANSVTEAVLDRAVVAAYGFLVLRAHAAQRVPAPAGLEQHAGRMLRECLAEPADARQDWAVSIPAAYLEVAHACARALAGDPRPDLWRHAVDILDRTGYALWRVRVQVHLAEDLWAVGDRAAARAVLHDTWHEADRMGAATVASAAAAAAHRRHVVLPELPLPGLQARLTPREREVLALIEDGATNRQIAEKLVISEKTVSVHVSNLLGKLGAAHRGEAVAIARRSAG